MDTTECKEPSDEMVDLEKEFGDADVDSVVDFTLHHSMMAIREGLTSPTDREMAAMARHPRVETTADDDRKTEVDDVANEKGQDKKELKMDTTECKETVDLEEEFGDADVDSVVDFTLQHSMMAIREGVTSPTDREMAAMARHPRVETTADDDRKTEVDDVVNEKGQEDKKDADHDAPVIRQEETGLRKEDTVQTKKDKKTKGKKNVFIRLLDVLLRRDKKKPKDDTNADGSNVKKEKKRPTKSSKKDWFRRNIFLCCVRNTATVAPMDD